jgi:FdhD protein
VTSNSITRDRGRPKPEIAAQVLRYRAGAYSPVRDLVAGEEPLEIRLTWQAAGPPEVKSIAVTMRTPGDDFALVAGFLHGEGIVRDGRDIVDIAYCVDAEDDQKFNIVTVTLRPGVDFDPLRLERNFFTSSSCGVCGKATLDALEILGCEMLPAGLAVRAETLMRLPAAIRDTQAVFSSTGGLHAAALFDADGEILDVREDVGRHNAFDKLIGAGVLAGGPTGEGRGVMLSGRASFELLQKALMARIPLVVAIGAPSSLAVSLAREFGITLVGFAKGDGFNVYSRADRIEGAPALGDAPGD